MNWDRRAFVKFAVGAVVGLHASPLVPKLMDDVAIWTQNWSWVPDPETGAVAFAKSINPDTLTGVKTRLVNARVSGPRVIRVEGDPEHPLSQGGVLAADASTPQKAYYGKMRADSAFMRKEGMRGRVGAEDALKEVAAKLSELAKAGKAKQVAIIADDPYSVTGEMLMRLAAAYGTPNLVFMPSAKQNLALAGQLMFGQSGVGFDLINSEYTISFGTPLLEGFGAPVATRKAFAAWRKDPMHRATLVQVEPRSSVTAGQADVWLACKPGTEGALAYAIANLIIDAGKADAAVTGAQGFDQFKAMLAGMYGIDKVSQNTGVPYDKIKAVADGFMKAEKAVAVCGPGDAGDPGKLFDFMAVLALNAVKGNLGKPGGVVLRGSLPWKALGEAMEMPSGPRLDGGDNRIMGLDNANELALAALKGTPYELEALIVVGCNPAFSGPQAKAMQQVIDQTPFVVSINEFMDETALMADVMLPAASYLECWGDCATAYGAPQAFYGVHQPLISIFPKAKAAGDWVLAIAKGLGGSVAAALPFEDTKAALAARAAGMGGLEDLAKKGYWMQEKPAYGFEFKTSSGSLELMPQGLGGKLPVPAPYIQPTKDRPLLMAGIPSLRTGSGVDPMSPYQLKILTDTTLAHTDQLVVEINPKTAQELHLGEGDMVEIASAAGKIEPCLATPAESDTAWSSTWTSAPAAVPARWPACPRTMSACCPTKPTRSAPSPGCGSTRSTTESLPRYRGGFFPRPCQHCAGSHGHHTPCVSVCPATATDYDHETGIVSQIPPAASAAGTAWRPVLTTPVTSTGSTCPGRTAWTSRLSPLSRPACAAWWKNAPSASTATSGRRTRLL
jgi:anaerobic selenocysteine-containing dehydrogenase